LSSKQFTLLRKETVLELNPLSDVSVHEQTPFKLYPTPKVCVTGLEKSEEAVRCFCRVKCDAPVDGAGRQLGKITSALLNRGTLKSRSQDFAPSSNVTTLRIQEVCIRKVFVRIQPTESLRLIESFKRTN